jgi:Leucine-rich repeat (LRR) protein
LINIEILELSENILTGPIPNTFGNLTKLTTLYLWGNNFSGHIPQELGRLINLEDLELSLNILTGPVPNSLGNLTKVAALPLYKPTFWPHPPRTRSVDKLRGLGA